MATQKDIEFSYDNMDELWRLSLGEHADITAAFFNGDTTKTLEQAQIDKHSWILEGINFKKGDKILDIGCGWGPMLKAIKERRGNGLGLTLSRAQLSTCKKHGLNARLQNWKDIDLSEIGKFDGIVSIGSFEHYCSADEYLEGKREEIYSKFFRTCYDLLKNNGRLFLQTMTLGKNPPWGSQIPTAEDLKKISMKAPFKSDYQVLAGMDAVLPGSCVPSQGINYLNSLATPYFDFIKNSDGRLDYVQTVTEWEKRWYNKQPGKTWTKIKALRHYLREGKNHWNKMKAIRENDVREVFIRDIFGHQRIFYEKSTK
tara:strand:- start:318 stop:1259 length:942 start_codon:yes stop_codon:yes gene_type:complete